MFLLISCFTVILLPFCVPKLIEFYTLPHGNVWSYPGLPCPALPCPAPPLPGQTPGWVWLSLEGYTLPLLSSTEASLCHGKWKGKKESAWGTMGRGKRRREVSSLSAFFTGKANRSPFGEERCILLIVASTGIRRCQGRGEELFRWDA